jgi:hypothetical protein
MQNHMAIRSTKNGGGGEVRINMGVENTQLIDFSRRSKRSGIRKRANWNVSGGQDFSFAIENSAHRLSNSNARTV